MSNPYKAHKTLLSGTTPYFAAWQTLKLPVFNIIRVRMLAGRNYPGKRTAYSGRLRPDTRLLRQLSDPLPARRPMCRLPKTLGARLDRGVLRSGDRFQRPERPSLPRSLSRPEGTLRPSPDHAGRTRHSAGRHRNAASFRGDQIPLRLRRAARRATVHNRPAYPANPNHRLLTCKKHKKNLWEKDLTNMLRLTTPGSSKTATYSTRKSIWWPTC